MLPLDELKEYLRIDGDDENALLERLVHAAENYLTNAGIKPNYCSDLYKLAITMLVSHWYENRIIEHSGRYTAKISFGFDTIITQLRYCQAQEEEQGEQKSAGQESGDALWVP